MRAWRRPPDRRPCECLLSIEVPKNELAANGGRNFKSAALAGLDHADMPRRPHTATQQSSTLIGGTPGARQALVSLAAISRDGNNPISMLESLKALVAELTGGGQRAEAFAENDYRIAATALLVHAATIDGDMLAAERDTLRALL